MASCSSSTNGQSENQARILLGDQPNQPKSFTFPKRTFGLKKPIYRSFQCSWFTKWPWLHYDQVNDKVYCFTCVKASTTGLLSSGAYKQVRRCLRKSWLYTNWKDASGAKKGGFPSHERSHFHKHCTGILAKSHRDIAEMMSTEHKKQKAVNRAYLSKVLENIVFLARQGLPFRGNWVPAEKEGEAGAEANSNFHQLLLLCAKDDPSILEVMHQKTRKYTDHHIQDELLKLLAQGHLRRIATNINEAGYFALQADEVTDSVE